MKVPDVISRLQELSQDGYIFRGQDDSKYQLIPNAFRPQSIEKIRSKFAVPPNLTDAWINRSLTDYQLGWLNASHEINSSFMIINLKKLCLNIMRYNYWLHLFVKNNPDYVSERDRKHLLLRDIGFWLTEDTFQCLLSSYLPTILYRVDLQGNWIQQARPFEELAGMDESLPQHYGVPTAALDWTQDFKTAIHFAIYERKPGGFCSIFALKLLSSDSPFKIVGKSQLINNIRAERQKGLFTYFTRPCSFYLQYGYFPAIDHYQKISKIIDYSTFELVEFQIECTENNLAHLNRILNQAGIDRDYLMPDLNSSLIIA